MFIRMHKGTVFDDKYLDTLGLDGYLRLPMSIESFTIPEELSAAMNKTINDFKGVAPADQGARKYIENFIAEIKKNFEILNQFVDKDLIL